MDDNNQAASAIVNAALIGDKEGFMNAFQNAIANKVGDALEVKKVELASTLVNTGNEDAYEIQEPEAEFTGSEE